MEAQAGRCDNLVDVSRHHARCKSSPQVLIIHSEQHLRIGAFITGEGEGKPQVVELPHVGVSGFETPPLPPGNERISLENQWWVDFRRDREVRESLTTTEIGYVRPRH